MPAASRTVAMRAGGAARWEVVSSKALDFSAAFSPAPGGAEQTVPPPPPDEGPACGAFVAPTDGELTLRWRVPRGAKPSRVQLRLVLEEVAGESQDWERIFPPLA